MTIKVANKGKDGINLLTPFLFQQCKHGMVELGLLCESCQVLNMAIRTHGGDGVNLEVSKVGGFDTLTGDGAGLVLLSMLQWTGEVGVRMVSRTGFVLSHWPKHVSSLYQTTF